MTAESQSSPEPTRGYAWFWAQAKELGLRSERVHALLGVRSIKELQERGMSLEQILEALLEKAEAPK